MTARIFADTNLFVYAEAESSDKSTTAIAVIEQLPVISTQVVNELVSVLTRKYRFQLHEAHEIAASLLDLCEVMPVGEETIRKAIELVEHYSLSHWDSLIVAAALLADCNQLYSEDLQHGQIFDNKLTVINPFLDANTLIP